MHAVLDTDIGRFAAAARPLIAADPVRNTVPGTVIRQVTDGELDHGAGSLWIRVIDEFLPGAPTVAVALRTAPRSLLLTAMPVAAAEAICDRLLESRMALPGVYGPEPASGAFARRWAERTGASPHITSRSRLFRLGELTPPQGVQGDLRAASTDDRDLLVRWTNAFGAEATPDQPPSDAGPMIDSRLRRPGTLWTWVDEGRPVSMLWISPPVAEVVRVSGVYTPPDLRGRGYASGCVAAVSARVTAAGHTCVLYTDLANSARIVVTRSRSRSAKVTPTVSGCCATTVPHGSMTMLRP
jgi:predicted GNAT family acetyltransferase